MSTALHMPAFNPPPYGLKENIDSFAPAFTSVNGQTSMSPISNDPKLSLSGGPWNSVSRPSEISYHSSSSSTSPASSGREDSPLSPGKRKRSDSEDNSHITSAGNSKPYSSPYQPVNQELSSRMDVPQQRTLPPIDRPEGERRWATEPREVPHNGYQEQQSQEQRSVDPSQGIRPPLHSSNGSTPPRHEGSVPTEMTRAGVQVEIKKRKRQFANRTKTGCGTCRRRKKKCDEAKPECNNCTRGGFICEGYANKVPWPKSGTPKAPPPLQARDRMVADPTAMYARCPVCNQIHIPHCDPPAHQTIYPDIQAPKGGDGARNRPINVDEHERKPSAPNVWGNGWSESAPPPSRVSYPPEQPVPQAPPPAQTAPPTHPPQYPPAPNAPVHERPVSHERHVAPQPTQSAPPRPHNPRVYHHTPQTLSQPPSSTPAVAVEPTAHHHHQVAQHPRPPPLTAPPNTAPPGPPPTHYAQQPPMHKSEKEKMLAGLPFMPYDRQLTDERHLCTGAVNQFNSTTSAAVAIARDERGRHFKTIIAARWIPPRTTERHIGGHLGGNVHVTAPFHCDYGYNISIGDNVVIGPSCQLLDSARICIGRNSKIGARVTISTMKTPTDPKSLKGSNGHEVAQDVWIGENVYIGDGCIIEAGVKIGDGAIVRAGSVVVRDLPRECIAHGNPAFG